MKPQPLTLDNQTEFGVAARFVREHGACLRFCPATGTWYRWSGTYWEPDRLLGRERMAKGTMAALIADAKRLPEAAARDAVKWARRFQSRRVMAAVMDLARSEPPITVLPEQLDAHPMLLAVANGTLDLRTGRLRASRPADLITRASPVRYDPGATCPRWMRFLEEVTGGDAEVQEYLRRWCGYTLTGETGEQALVILHGNGSNGKSTFAKALLALLGDGLARRAPPNLLMARRNEAHPTELMEVRGRRLVIVPEVPRAATFDEERVKTLTGSDPVSARGMYQDFSSFPDTAKLVVLANHLPAVRDASHAFWRRIRVVPFPTRFALDRGFEARLLRELPGILTWAAQGCLGWQRDGLGTAAAIDLATATYRGEQPLFGEFLDGIDEATSRSGLRTSELAEIYANWAAARSQPAMTGYEIGARMTDYGWLPCAFGHESARGWRKVR